MNAFRGARCIANTSMQSVRLCRSQQHRRLLSLAFPALSQKLLSTTRSVFQDAIVSPVNKYDLSGGTGVLSSTCSALFSTVTDAISDEETSSLDDSENSEAGTECRWPSPVHQHRSTIITKRKKNSSKTSLDSSQVHSNTNAVFVGGYNFDHSETALRNVFSRFGPVMEVSVPKMRLYNRTAVDTDTYRFAFVRFRDQESVKRALEANNVQAENGGLIDIKERNSSENKQDLLVKKSLVVKNLPDDFTVQKCIQHFGDAGDLRVVNIVFNNLMQRPNEKSFVFLVYESAPDVTLIESALAAIPPGDLVVEAFKASAKQPPLNRSKKVFLEGIGGGLPMDALVNHFKKYGSITYSKLFDKVTDQNSNNVDKRTAVIEYEDSKSAMDASEEMEHAIEGFSPITVRSLGWRKEEVEA